MKHRMLPLRHGTALAAVAVLASLSAVAQSAAPPDLSGTWKLNLQKSKLEKGGDIPSHNVLISCTGSTIQMNFANSGEPTYTYIADGKERSGGADGRREIFFKASWKRSVLIVETRVHESLSEVAGSPFGWDLIHMTERWTLSTDGKVLTRDFGNAKEIYLYDKQ